MRTVFPPAAADFDEGRAGRRTATASRRSSPSRQRRADDYDHDREKIQDAKDNLRRTMLTLARARLRAGDCHHRSSSGSSSGASAGTGYDREYEQEPPSEEPPAHRAAAPAPGHVSRLARVHRHALRPHPPRLLRREAGHHREEDLGGHAHGAGRRSRAVDGRHVGRADDVRRARRQGLRPHPRRRPRAPVEDARSHRDDAHLEQQTLRELQRRRLRRRSASGTGTSGRGAKFARPRSSLCWSSPPSCCSGWASPASGPWRRAGTTSSSSRSASARSSTRSSLVIGVGNTKLWRRRTRDGQLEAQRWEAFRRYLSDFPRLDDAPPATLELWERFLVYGIAFGIAERVLQGAQLHMPEELPRRELDLLDQPARRSRLRRERARDRRPLGGLRLGARAAGFERLGRLRRRLLGRRRRWWRRRRRRRLVSASDSGCCSYRAIAPATATLSDSASRPSGSTRRRRTLEHVRRQSLALGAEHERHPLRQLHLTQQADLRPRRARFAARARRRSRAAVRGRLRLPSHAAPSTTSDRHSPPIARRMPPNASAVRINVPTLPGSATCQSASPTGRLSPPKVNRAETPRSLLADARAPTRPRAAFGSTSSRP